MESSSEVSSNISGVPDTNMLLAQTGINAAAGPGNKEIWNKET